MALCAGAIHGVHPARVPALAACMALDPVSVPGSVDWFAACPPDADALGNDTHGCCVEAADYRWIQATLANAGSPGWRPTRDLVLARYAAMTGFNPATGAGDLGTPVVADIADLTTRGIRLTQLQRDFVPWVARIGPLADAHLAIGIGHVGPAPVTFRLPRNWRLIETDPNAWNVSPGASADFDPGTGQPGDPVEEHRVLFGRFDGLTRWVRSWGLDLPVHPDWWRRYCLGVDLLVDRSSLDATGRTALGLDLSGLMRVMGALS